MRTRLVLVIAAVALGAGAVAAQNANVIKARQAIMKSNIGSARALTAMVKGQAPFDAAKVDAAFAEWADAAKKLPDAFPDDSKTGEKTRASPKIWENRADFNAHVAAFAKTVADNKDKAKTLDGLKVALPAVGKACANCHDTYRLPKS